MKPSHQRTALMVVPVTIYLAAMGWKFVAGLLGLVLLQYVLHRVIVRIVPPTEAEKKS